jgi:hypothetical protein
MGPVISLVDHLVYATPDLDTSIRDLERLLGVRASVGGQHLGRGTRNALIAIGERAYLEIIGPDPDQPAPNGPRWFNVDAIDTPRIVTWAAHGTDLPRLVETRSVPLGAVVRGSRLRQDGVTLAWQLTDPSAMLGDGLVPFFIDWGMSPHPSSTATRGPRLIALRAEHPSPPDVSAQLDALGIPLELGRAKQPAIIATFDGPGGTIEIT